MFTVRRLIHLGNRPSSTGQIAGEALVNATGEVHAFLLTPCMHACEGAAAVAPSGSVPRLHVTVPDNVRQFLQRRAQFGGFKRGLATPQ